MRNSIVLAGVGPGTTEYILPVVKQAIENADLIIGSKRIIHDFHLENKKTIEMKSGLEGICKQIANIDEKTKIVILVSGDPGIFSFMEYIKRNLPDIKLTIYPGISSFQYLCSKLCISWHDVKIISFHGREEFDLIKEVKNNYKTVIFAGGKTLPSHLCKQLVENGLENLRVIVGENLSYKEERIIDSIPIEISKMKFNSLSIMLIINPQYKKNIYLKDIKYNTHGIPDECFIRDKVPMTKEEIRSVSLSKLKLEEDNIVFDIGAGTGSVSIECALKCEYGRVYAIEKNELAVELLKKNIEAFKVSNIQVIEGFAPQALIDLPIPNRVFIGGTSGNMNTILQWIKNICKEVRVVINAVTIESVYEALQALKKYEYKNIEIVNVSISKSRVVGDKHLMQANNPIYIISTKIGGN